MKKMFTFILSCCFVIAISLSHVPETTAQQVEPQSFLELYGSEAALPNPSTTQKAVPEPSGNPMSGSRAVTYYSDRGIFDADNPGLPVEDFENGNIPAFAIIAINNPLDEFTNNGIYSPGDVLPGIQINSTGTAFPILVGLGVGAAGNASKIVLPNFFVDAEKISFNPPVTAVGFDVHDFIGGSTCQIDIFDAGDALLASTTSAATAAGVFFGVYSDTPIGEIVINSLSGGGEGADNIAFGNAGVVPVSNWALYLGILLIAIFAFIRFRKY